MSSNQPLSGALQYLKGGGEMGRLIRDYDWSQTSIGTPDTWPQSLLTTLSIMLGSRFPMFLWWGPDLIQFYNDAYRPSLGNEGKHPAALGQEAVECWPEIWDVIHPLIEQVMTGGESSFFEDRLIPIYRNNRLEDVYWTFSYSRVDDESGQPGGVLVICNETTKQVKAHSELKHAKEELDFALEAAGLGTWDLDPQTNRFLGNGRLKEWFGIAEAKEIDLARATDSIAPRDRQRVLDAIAYALTPESGGHYDIEYTILNPLEASPVPRLVRAKGKALFDTQGNATRFSGTLQDITAEKKAADALQESSQRLELALDAANLGSYDLNLVTGKMVCNAQYKANFGYPENEPFHLDSFVNAILPEYKAEVLRRRDIAIATNTLYHAEYPVKWKDGSIHWISVYGKPFYGENGDAVRIIGISSDITHQVNAQMELERAYEQARLSKEAAQLGTFDLDLQTGKLEWDERCRTLFGISHSGPVTYDDDFLSGLHPDDRDRVESVIADVFIKEKSNGDYDVEYRTVGVEDQKLRWVRAKGKTYFDNNERPLRFIGSVLDITEQKSDEIRKNDFISMVSHELKTPLTSLKAYIQMLLLDGDVAKNDFRESALQKAELQVNRMGKLIDGFLNVSRLESGKLQLYKEHFELAELIDPIIEEARLIFSSHAIQTAAGCDDVKVYADREKLGSVILNLLSNAVKYSAKGSAVELSCKADDQSVVISVRDEGCGISEQDMTKLFSRFYRIESNHNRFIAGFGIGLYLCAEIIREHKGTISVESELGKGSVFHISIPVAGAS